MQPRLKTDQSLIFFYLEHKKHFESLPNVPVLSYSFMAPNPALWTFKSLHAPAISNVAIRAGEPQQATIDFHHSGQYSIYYKALYFSDTVTAWMISRTNSPMECRFPGRAVKPLSQERWRKDDMSVRVMDKALWWKFGGDQLSNLLQRLKNIIL